MANLSAIPLPGREREAGIERRKEGGRRTNFAEQSFPNYTGNRGTEEQEGGRRKIPPSVSPPPLPPNQATPKRRRQFMKKCREGKEAEEEEGR